MRIEMSGCLELTQLLGACKWSFCRRVFFRKFIKPFAPDDVHGEAASGRLGHPNFLTKLKAALIRNKSRRRPWHEPS